jgi:phosphatidylinositol alpha-1,6-mannosyltransferase
MRLILLSTEFPPGPGGIGTHAFELARQLTAVGWTITVVTPQDYVSADEAEAFNRAQPFAVVRLRPVPGAPLKLLSRWLVANRAIQHFNPRALVASGERAVWLGHWLARRHQVPWVAVGHGSEFAAKPRWKFNLTRSAFEHASRVVCVSQFTAGQMTGIGIRPQQTLVIPNGADEARFTMLPEDTVLAFRKKIGLPDAQLLLTVGNVTERKGQQVVIRALPHILKARPNTHYLMAGLPTRQEDFLKLARDLGVAEHVHFLGRVPAADMIGYMNCADVFAMTSTITADGDCEGYGIAVVEAALCGKPAVVSANSGLAEAIVDGVTGIAVPAGDEVATATAIVRLLQDDKQRRAMGQAALRRALQEQTWSNRVKEYDELLRQLMPAAQAARS